MADQLQRQLVAALEQNSPARQAPAIGLANRDKPARADWWSGLEDGGRHVVHELERFLNTLGTIAAVAPLLDCWERWPASFMRSMRSRPMGSAIREYCPGGIGEALITTAAGLTVAIPSLIAYRFLRGKVERLVVRMEKEP